MMDEFFGSLRYQQLGQVFIDNFFKKPAMI